jgi:hypothetical protein
VIRIRKLFVLLVALLATFAASSCSAVEDRLDRFKLPRNDVGKAQRALEVALAASPDSDSDGTVNGLEWVAFIEAVVAEYEK